MKNVSKRDYGQEGLKRNKTLEQTVQRGLEKDFT